MDQKCRSLMVRLHQNETGRMHHKYKTLLARMVPRNSVFTAQYLLQMKIGREKVTWMDKRGRKAAIRANVKLLTCSVALAGVLHFYLWAIWCWNKAWKVSSSPSKSVDLQPEMITTVLKLTPEKLTFPRLYRGWRKDWCF